MNPQNKKYLITSVYTNYDDWDIQPVCVCETEELAKSYVNMFKHQIEVFKSIQGYVIYLDESEDSEFIKSFEEENIAYNCYGDVQVFLTTDEYEYHKTELEDECYDVEETNYFEFMGIHYKKDTITKKYCSNKYAKFVIEELDYIN